MQQKQSECKASRHTQPFNQSASSCSRHNKNHVLLKRGTMLKSITCLFNTLSRIFEHNWTTLPSAAGFETRGNNDWCLTNKLSFGAWVLSSVLTVLANQEEAYTILSGNTPRKCLIFHRHVSQFHWHTRHQWSFLDPFINCLILIFFRFSYDVPEHPDAQVLRGADGDVVAHIRTHTGQY